MRPNEAGMIWMLGLGSLALVASGAGAEWLVTADGSRVEIDGPWKVEGRRVTFTMPNGTLGSMPLAEVDLDASEALARQAQEAAERSEEPMAKPKAVMVITDADVRKAPSGEAGGDQSDTGARAESSNPGLRVGGWRESVDQSRNVVRITGDLQNPTENPATSIDLEVQLYDANGELLESSVAQLDRSFLNPGASVRFQADFEDTLSFDDIRFQIRSRGFLAKPPPDESEATGEESGEPEGEPIAEEGESS